MSLLQKLCARLTGHRFHRKYDTCKKGERWCRCRICGYHFWIKED